MARVALAVLVPGLFVCVLSTRETIQLTSDCGGYTLIKGTGGYLMYNEMPVTFSNAKKRCAMEGGFLASPINEGIKAAMTGILKTRGQRKNAFTGFSAKPKNGGVFTSIEGTRLSNIKHTWNHGEPNNLKGKENCIVMSSHGTMADVKCSKRYPYFCFRVEKVKNVCGKKSGDYTLDNSTESCYKYHNTESHFNEAVKICEKEGGHLLIIKGDAEAEAVKKLFLDSARIYVLFGVKFLKNSGEWVTIQGERIEVTGYVKWLPGEGMDPTSHLSLGLLGTDGILYYAEHNTPYTFICEKVPEILFCE